MPNRYLRASYIESDSVSSLSLGAEVLWTRLVVTVDDFGRHEANPALLRPKIFPLRLADVREADLVRWIAECEKANLVRLYNVRGKQYLQMMRWEKGRAKSSKCPAPPAEILGSCYLGSDPTGMLPPTHVDACKHMSTRANISPDSDTDSDSEERERDRARRGAVPPEKTLVSLPDLMRRVAALRPQWRREDHEWTEVERAALMSADITEGAMRLIESRYAAGKGKARKIRWFAENWTDDLADDLPPPPAARKSRASSSASRDAERTGLTQAIEIPTL